VDKNSEPSIRYNPFDPKSVCSTMTGLILILENRLCRDSWTKFPVTMACTTISNSYICHKEWSDIVVGHPLSTDTCVPIRFKLGISLKDYIRSNLICQQVSRTVMRYLFLRCMKHACVLPWCASIAHAGHFSNDNMQVRAPSLVLVMSTRCEPRAYVHPLLPYNIKT
jgi:hypothetical protein